MFHPIPTQVACVCEVHRAQKRIEPHWLERWVRACLYLPGRRDVFEIKLADEVLVRVLDLFVLLGQVGFAEDGVNACASHGLAGVGRGGEEEESLGQRESCGVVCIAAAFGCEQLRQQRREGAAVVVGVGGARHVQPRRNVRDELVTQRKQLGACGSVGRGFKTLRVAGRDVWADDWTLKRMEKA
eukprot:6213535-Pleurochrysis_carterae.AAC.1